MRELLRELLPPRAFTCASHNERYTGNSQSHRVSSARRCLPVAPDDLESDEHFVEEDSPSSEGVPPLTASDLEMMASDRDKVEFDLTLVRRGSIENGAKPFS